jgi:hypothetical protein
MKHLHIICKATPSIFSEAITAICQIFKESGWRTTFDPSFKMEDQRKYSEDVNLVVKAQRQYPPDHLPEEAVNILFQTEQFSKLREFDSMPYTENWDLILDVFSDNVRRVANQVEPGKIKYFPIGYHEAYQWKETKGRAIKDNECINDIYFFGARTPYRRDLWDQIVTPIGGRSRFAFQDRHNEKYKYITHSKINLFIDGWDPYLLPMMHCMQILANQKTCVAITDNVDQRVRPYVKGLHFIMVKPKDAKERIRQLLFNEMTRMRFAEEMFERIQEENRFSQYLKEAVSDHITL